MPKVIIIETTDVKITKQQALDWIGQLGTVDLKLAGSLLIKDFSYKDLDLTLHTHPCKDVAKQLPSASFPIEIFCRVCGATITYNPDTDTWTWRYSKSVAVKTLAFPIDKTGVSAKDFWTLWNKVLALEAKAAGRAEEHKP